jgi:hypothetical protein
MQQQQQTVLTAQHAAALYSTQVVVSEGWAHAQVSKRIKIVSGPLGTTVWLDERPYAWAPGTRDAAAGERCMLYTHAKQRNGLTLARGQRVELREYNNAVAAVLQL